MTDQPKDPVHPGAYCPVEGATGQFKTGRAGVCSRRNPGDRLRWRASGPPPEKPKKGRRRTTPLGIVIPEQQILALPEPPPTETRHNTQVLPVEGEQAFTVTCSCEQRKTIRYARATGKDVAHRLAAIHGARHEEDPAGNPLTDGGLPLLLAEDEIAQSLAGPPAEHVDGVKQLMADVQRQGRFAGLRAVPAAPQGPADEAQATPTREPQTGWPNAARRRAARRFGPRGGADPVGTRAGGFTVYNDGEPGHGEAQIWDKS